MKNISLICAYDLNRAIGKENKLLCHLPDDLKNFKRITSGCTILMGRKTWDSLPFKPLPNRTNIILTKNSENIDSKFKRNDDNIYHDIIFANSIEMAISLLDSDRENFIIGGAEIYKQFLPFSNKMYITRILHEFEGCDAFFPEFNNFEWNLVAVEAHKIDDKHKYEFDFEVYERKNKPKTI